MYIGLAKMFEWWVFPYDVMGKLFAHPQLHRHTHTHITVVMYAAFKIQILHKGLSGLTHLHIRGVGVGQQFMFHTFTLEIIF